MTKNEREEAIKIMENEVRCVRNPNCERLECRNCYLAMPEHTVLKAYEVAIKALEQEPCEDTISRASAINAVSEALEHVFVEHEDIAKKMINKLPPVKPQQPCWDVISRDTALEKMADYVASGYADSVEDFEKYSRIICQLPSVNPQVKIGHWIDLDEKSAVCSCCNRNNTLYGDFCKWCGAIMLAP